MKSNLYPTCDTGNLELVKQQKIKSQRRVATNITQHLCFVLQVKQGRELVLLFGKGHECSSHEALNYWVLKKLQGLSGWPLASEDLKVYVRQLELEVKEELLEFCECWS